MANTGAKKSFTGEFKEETLEEAWKTFGQTYYSAHTGIAVNKGDNSW
jgi:hypothetical protein